MSRTRTAAAVSAAALLGVALLAGCSSSSEPAATDSAAASEGSSQVLPPVIITEDQTAATAKVGDYLDIIVSEDKLAGTTVSTDQPELVELTQAKEEGGAMFNPGGKTLAPGTAVIVVTSPDSSTRDITLTITE
jgi:ABC-type phosphate/phosphonate transport system substrate-binding protein